MIWTKECDEHIADSNGYSAIITRTYSCPPGHIPKAQRWTLELFGPWYVCRCFPTIKAAKQAAERVIAALKEEE